MFLKQHDLQIPSMYVTEKRGELARARARRCYKGRTYLDFISDIRIDT